MLAIIEQLCSSMRCIALVCEGRELFGDARSLIKSVVRVEFATATMTAPPPSHHFLHCCASYDPLTMSTTSIPLQVVFVHLDLGIGGAEQLVLSLAKASLDAGHDVQLVTAHCRQNHCFDIVKKPDGELSERVHVWGHLIPSSVLKMGTALCSSVRLAYLCHWTTRVFPHADLVVLDVLPTPIPLLLPYTSVLFYSHFPDKLLTRDTVNGEIIVGGQERSVAKQWYRHVLDALEEGTMGLADLLVVNSNFTQGMIESTFPSLREQPMRVLYPALQCDAQDEISKKTLQSPIVSLNRYERKKNIQLLLLAYALLKKSCGKKQLPPLIVAGGYDTSNVENVEYMGELQTLASTLEISVTFLRSISDEQRQSLLREALCVVYTPHLEHFGIVPLEAMAAGTPVVAVNSGGPKETVVDGVTGCLCEGTPQAFANALQQYVTDVSLATRMGTAGRNHVRNQFSQLRFQQQWISLVKEAVTKGRKRLGTQTYVVCKGLVYVFEAMVALLCVLLLTLVLRAVGVLEADAHIFGSIKRALYRDEL